MREANVYSLVADSQRMDRLQYGILEEVVRKAKI